MIKKLTKNTVREITYRCPLDRETETGTIHGFWTGEVDTWGKLTIRVVDIIDGADALPSTHCDIYLFPREITAIAQAVR